MNFHRYVPLLLLVMSLLIFNSKLNAQSIPYEGPTDEAGDPSASRLGLMNGNRVSLQISNKVSFGGWPSPLVSLWPNDASGLNTFDSFNLIVGNMVFIKKCDTCAADTVPVVDESEIQLLSSQGQLDTVKCIESSSIQPDFMPGPVPHPISNIHNPYEWGFYPVFGYFNTAGETPAMSNHPESWPPGGWPSRGLSTKWPGEWDGRFGRGVKYADLEAYWVCNDAQDQKHLQMTGAQATRVRYYPRPGVKIGDLHPGDISIQKGDPWGGLGLRAEVRAYQWNNQESQDCVFFEYNVSNISDYDLARAVFGFYLDAANGNKSPTSAAEDQIGFYDKSENFTYTWSMSGAGFGGGRPAVSGWAFLESPGIATDGIDNNNNGMVDERRDNTAEESWHGLPQKIVGRDAVRAAFFATHDTTKFLPYYGYLTTEQIPAIQNGVWWPADEDGDWRDGKDKNGNGVYDVGEDAGDDVGLDGVAPGDLNYTGPDADGTECNHKPDFKVGIGAEPNFASTDVGESDMLGLTSFVMFPHPQTNGALQLWDSPVVYDTLAMQALIPFFGIPSNLYAAFGSGTFRLAQGRTERLSMCNVNSYDDLSGLNNAAANHPAPSLYAKKKIVNAIYANDYRFAQPPVTPTLTAKAGDGKVYLYWDDRSEKLTRQPFLGGINDFEGYKLYRATDKYFQDAEVLRDGYGNAAGKLPIFQCDLKDSVSGFADWASYNGLSYYLGNNTGIKNTFIDSSVQNGITYFYALVAYNYGMKGVGTLAVNVPPTEDNITITIDESGTILSVGPNVQIVTPHKAAAGYVDPKMTFTDPANVLAEGTIQSTIYNSDNIKSNHMYKIKFRVDTIGFSRTATYRCKRDGFFSTTGYSISDASSNDSLLYSEIPGNNIPSNWDKDTLGTVYYIRPSSNGITSKVVDGMQLFIKPFTNKPVFDSVNTGWQTGSVPMEVKPNVVRAPYFAYDYNIIFVDTTLEPSYKSITARKANPTPVYDISNNALASSRVLLGQSFPFHVINKSFRDSTTSGYKGFEQVDMVVQDMNVNGKYDPDTDYVLVSYTIPYLGQLSATGTIFGFRFPHGMPHPGDVYNVKFINVMRDSILFSVNLENTTNVSKINDDMSQIKVVPNPYLVTNTMEPYVSSQNINQQRVLLFTHVPAKSTIKIFTSSGVFIRQLNVDNAADNGNYKWDMLTKEGMDIAAGVYIYYIKSNITGKEKLGKFAVIK
jgi:hypothetical protein